MTAIKHTPGPWTLETVRTSTGICHKIGPFPWRRDQENHACIYVDYASEGGTLERELLANARLIAAAPELLAALRFAADALDDLGIGGGQTARASRPQSLRPPAMRDYEHIHPSQIRALGSSPTDNDDEVAR